MLGYAGKILRVNLSDEKISVNKLDEKDVRSFLGGRGLAAKILFDEIRPEIDPLGDENKLIFMTGPLTGSSIPGTTRFGVFAKSPLTGCWGESNAAGWFALELKASGYDGLIVEGKATHPVYLWICNGEVAVLGADNLWGKYTLDTEGAIRGELNDPKARIASIGPSGEKLVRFACIIHEGHRAAGRTGLGAVMGSKRLKAIAVRGEKRFPMADEEKLKGLIQSILPRFRDNEYLQNLGRYGTDTNMMALNYEGGLPTKNFQDGAFDAAEDISGETMSDSILENRLFCPDCPIGCIRAVNVKSGSFAPVSPGYGGPEYETAAAFGANCCNDNLESIAKANMLCNMYGVDTISMGVTVAFAIECYENGFLTEKETGGLKLGWGDGEVIVRLAELIAKREGIGDVLAEGVKRATQHFGKGTEKYAMHVKGLELPMHDPRGKKGVGFSYATSNRGACHLQTFHDPILEKPDAFPEIGVQRAVDRFATDRTKVQYVIKGEHAWGALPDSLIICKFTFPDLINLRDIPEIIRAVTGWKLSIEELMTIAERIFNLCRAFNVREGITRNDDTLPGRFGELTNSGGIAWGQTFSEIELNRMLDDYYELRGWDKNTGIPKREKLEKLQLGFAAEELKKLGKIK